MIRQDLYYLWGYSYSNITYSEDNQTVFFKNSQRKFFDLVSGDIRGRLEKTKEGWILSTDDKQVLEFLQSRKALPDEEYADSFLAGVFDSYGEMDWKSRPDSIRIGIKSDNERLIDYISKNWGIKTFYANKIFTYGFRALDILGRMYGGGTKLIDRSRLKRFWQLVNYDEPFDFNTEKLQYCKLDPKAVTPSKSRVTDVGYDISVISLEKVKGDIWKGKTGLSVKPISGYYFDLIARSSLPNKGWQILNGVGVIDPSYRGALELSLFKLDDEPLPKLPCRFAQLILRKAVHAEWEETRKMEETDRGHKGFGSTD